MSLLGSPGPGVGLRSTGDAPSEKRVVETVTTVHSRSYRREVRPEGLHKSRTVDGIERVCNIDSDSDAVRAFELLACGENRGFAAIGGPDAILQTFEVRLRVFGDELNGDLAGDAPNRFADRCWPECSVGLS